MRIILDDQAKVPTKAHESDAGYDLYCREAFSMKPGDYFAIDTGVHFLITLGLYGKIEGRSGLLRKGIFVPGGVIDPDYTGSVRVILYNFSNEYKIFKQYDRIAQIIFMSYYNTDFRIVDEFEITDRGNNGFGSSGS